MLLFALLFPVSYIQVTMCKGVENKCTTSFIRHTKGMELANYTLPPVSCVACVVSHSIRIEDLLASIRLYSQSPPIFFPNCLYPFLSCPYYFLPCPCFFPRLPVLFPPLPIFSPLMPIFLLCLPKFLPPLPVRFPPPPMLFPPLPVLFPPSILSNQQLDLYPAWITRLSSLSYL